MIHEFEFIKRFSSRFQEKLPGNVTGIGDDCAVIPYIDGHSLLISTDTLVDTVHFLIEKMPASDLAQKSLAVNLSDIAAMGGKPLYVFLALAIPLDLNTKWSDSFFAGLSDGCSEYNVHLIGGDTTKSPDKLVITLTVIGSALTKHIKYRSTAKVGDYICLTGNIGDSAGGLQFYIEDNNNSNQIEKEVLKKAHLRPRPHIREGQWLALQKGVNAMIDISDGIESDIKRILESSVCGADIELTSLPISGTFRKVAEEQGWDCYEMAVTGGEDYCLMTTVDAEYFETISESFGKEFNTPLAVIGRITAEGLIFRMNREIIDLRHHGYDHFR